MTDGRVPLRAGGMVERLISDLEAFGAGKLAARDFRLRHPVTDVDQQLQEIMCSLEHYLADADVRERDAEYRHFQDGELRKLIGHLRDGHFEEATAIDFLRRTF